jgi:DNA-binding XRE family transcriptional regulator
MRNLREDRDLTQREVGAVINKSQQGYSHIEDGRAELKITSSNFASFTTYPPTTSLD